MRLHCSLIADHVRFVYQCYVNNNSYFAIVIDVLRVGESLQYHLIACTIVVVHLHGWHRLSFIWSCQLWPTRHRRQTCTWQHGLLFVVSFRDAERARAQPNYSKKKRVYFIHCCLETRVIHISHFTIGHKLRAKQTKQCKHGQYYQPKIALIKQ